MTWNHFDKAVKIPAPTLPTTSAERKSIPITRGVLDYFPAALAEVAKVSKAGNEKHNKGQPLHHARGKSTDHADSIARHLLERGGIDADTGVRHSAELAWRALALLQQELEDAGAPVARGAKLPVSDEPGQIIAVNREPKLTYYYDGSKAEAGRPRFYHPSDYSYHSADDPADNPAWQWSDKEQAPTARVIGNIGNEIGQFRYRNGAWRKRIA